MPRRSSEPLESSLVIHNVVVSGHRTSVRLEPLMWESLHEIARDRDMTLHELVSEINRNRTTSSLTAGIRVYIVAYYRSAARRGDRFGTPLRRPSHRPPQEREPSQ
ncbi:MAG TPA: ribbon-helix-helix domain-containing protein [Stellaceae bacterium]|nr:ribbon-helix-helix domain-containing protein [Stellaceae bacterium]